MYYCLILYIMSAQRPASGGSPAPDCAIRSQILSPPPPYREVRGRRSGVRVDARVPAENDNSIIIPFGVRKVGEKTGTSKNLGKLVGKVDGAGRTLRSLL